MIIHHITLSTGHRATHRLDMIPTDVIDACRSLLPDGGPIQATDGFRVEVVGPIFTIYHRSDPVIVCGIGGWADATWSELVALQQRFMPMVQEPATIAGRWLAVVLLPGASNLTRANLGWMGDFERCMAAAILL